MTSFGEAVAAASARIGRTDAVALATHAWGVTRAWLVSHDRDTLAAALAQRYDTLVEQRQQGSPVAYLTGLREFYGRAFAVSPAVLIPRPETELIVEAALARLPKAGRLLDLGTGSGAIAVTVACERPYATVVATDVSGAALAVARDNARRHGASVDFRPGNWFEPVDAARFDIIVSNPPYVAALDPHLGQGDLRFEPGVALSDGSPDGLASLKTIISGAQSHLLPGGWLLLEHGHDQGERCARLLEAAGFVERVAMADLAGLSRVAGGRRQRPG